MLVRHDEVTACADDECGAFTSPARLGILLEPAHAWLEEALDSADRQAFLQLVGVDVRYDSGVAWRERSVEWAAEIVAWGLMHRELQLVRLGSPTCPEPATAFELLTGAVPLIGCGS